MKSILVLAHHPGLADAIREALPADQYRIIPRFGLEDAEPFLQPGAIDLCVLDAESADVQGLWTIEKLRQRLPTCPVFVFTSAKPWEWEEEAYVQGVLHVLAKPVRPRVLGILLSRLFSGTSPSPVRASATRRQIISAAPPRVVESGQTQVRTLEVLRDFSSILTHSLCAEAMLKQFLLLLREIIGVNRAVIFLRAPTGGFGSKAPAAESRHFRSACAIGLSTGLLEHFELSPEAGLGGYVYRKGRIIHRDSDEAMDDPEMQKEFELLGVEVAIPILDRETLIGIAAFDGRITGGPLGNAELELIFHLLEQLGMAIRNVWLHDQLAANHEMMADILRQLSSACVVIGQDLTILHSNKTARNYFTKPGQRKAELEFTDLPQFLASKVFQVLKTGTALATFRYQPEEAPQEAYQVSIVPFQRQDSVLPTSALLLIEDRTQTEQLQQLELEAANLRLVKVMADRMAHEIGNAMVPLSTHQQLLAERYKDPEFRASLGVAMAEGVKRVSRLINQMRFLARDSTQSREVFPLAPLIEEAYQEAQKHHPTKSAQLRLETTGAPPVVNGDRAALKHAFTEVLLNALQANPSDAKITVRAKLTTANGALRNGSATGSNPAALGPALQIEVQDNGPGFSPESLKRAPEPFFTTRNVGLGLGMSVSRKIVETHHGELAVLSNSAGKSGIVRITLPADENAAAEPTRGGVA